MAIGPPKCFERHCRHFQGVYQPNGEEPGEHFVCKAFPKGSGGIPREICVGDNPHTAPFPGDGGITYEEGPFDRDYGDDDELEDE